MIFGTYSKKLILALTAIPLLQLNAFAKEVEIEGKIINPTQKEIFFAQANDKLRVETLEVKNLGKDNTFKTKLDVTSNLFFVQGVPVFIDDSVNKLSISFDTQQVNKSIAFSKNIFVNKILFESINNNFFGDEVIKKVNEDIKAVKPEIFFNHLDSKKAFMQREIEVYFDNKQITALEKEYLMYYMEINFLYQKNNYAILANSNEVMLESSLLSYIDSFDTTYELFDKINIPFNQADIIIGGYVAKYQALNNNIVEQSKLLKFIFESIKNKKLATSVLFHYIYSNLVYINKNEIKEFLTTNSKYYLGESFVNEINTRKNFLLTLEKGSPAKEIKGYNLKNKIVKLSDFKGKTILVYLWASYCQACTEAYPIVKKIFKAHEKDKNFVLLMVSSDHTKEAWKQGLLGKEKLKNQVDLILTSDFEELAFINYELPGTPSYIIIDKNHKIDKISIDYFQLESELTNILK